MKIVLIILFFILILIMFSNIKIDIQKFEVKNEKIKFDIKLKIYILKYIKIFQKRITKKDIKKIIKFSKKNKLIKKEENFLKKVEIHFSEFYFNCDIGITNILINIYVYALLNAVISSFIGMINIEKENRKFKISTDFDDNHFLLGMRGKIEIPIFKNIKNAVKSRH